MILFILFSCFTYASTSPLEGLSGAYVSEAIEAFQKSFPDQEQEILNQLWLKSMGVEDDLFEADVVEDLKKSGFSPGDIRYETVAGVTNIEIKNKKQVKFLEIRNPFTGEFSIREKTFYISDYQRAEDVYDAIYNVFKKEKLTDKERTIFSSVVYILVGLIGTKIDSQKCFNDIERAIADIQKARKECIRTYAEVKKGVRSPASEDYLAKTILLKGMTLEKAKDPFCMDFANKIQDRSAKAYFFNKYSCVNNFRAYCRDVIDLVNCQSQMNMMSNARSKGKIQLRNDKTKEPLVN